MKRAVKAVLGGVAVVVALDAARVALWRPRPLEGPAPADGFARVSGVVHVHTTLSDGGGTPEEAIAAARRAGLGFLVITDHNTLDAKPAEGIREGLLVLVGVEASTASGHVVGLGLPDPVFRFSGDAHDTLLDIHELGGHAFVAHPASRRADLRWTAWDEPGPWGIEVFNGDSQWRQAGWPARAQPLTTYALNRRYALLTSLGRPTDELGRWDAMLARRPTPAIGGADAHGQIELSRKASIPLPSYDALFALGRNHVLLEGPLSGQLESDRQALVEALARGRSYFGLDGLAVASGFSFVAESGGRRWTMGDTVPAQPAPRLRVGGRLPAGTRLALMRDGRTMVEGTSALEVAAAGPGVYRVEAYVPGWQAPWIVSNAIAIFDDSEAAGRAQRAAWPEEPPAPAAAAMIADFDREAPFEPGFDARSSVATPVHDPSAGVSGGAARLAFRLGLPDEGHPHTFCALVNRADRDLTGRQGLVFSVRADGAYRMWVQVRDANPASPDEGTEWWFASVKTTPQWRRVAVPFSRLRSIQRNSDGRLDPDKVRALVFIVDRGAVKPGTSGTIWIDELGVY